MSERNDIITCFSCLAKVSSENDSGLCSQCGKSLVTDQHVGGWLLEQKLSENDEYTTYISRRTGIPEIYVIKVIEKDDFSDSDYSRLQSLFASLPPAFALNSVKEVGQFVFYRPFYETSLKAYLNNSTLRAPKAVKLMQQVVTELIKLKQNNIYPAHLSIGNLLLAEDGSVILSDLLLKECLVSGQPGGTEEETVKVFAELCYHLCCRKAYDGADVELQLRDEVPSSLENFLNVLLKEQNTQMTLKWILTVLLKLESGSITGPVAAPVAVVESVTEKPKTFSSRPAKTKVKFDADKKPSTATVASGSINKKKSSNKLIAVGLAAAIVVLGGLLFLMKGSGNPADTSGTDTVVLSKEAASGSEKSKPAFEIPKPVVRPEIDLSTVKDKLHTGLEHDLLRGDKIPDDWQHDWNLGPTGARGWMYHKKMETSLARQIQVTSIDKGSPAEGSLEKDDIILGVEEKMFSYDPRIEFGKAIGDVEATDGEMSLIVSRGGKFIRVKLKLPVLGGYTYTSPFECDKTKQIIDGGCKAIADRLKDKKRRKHTITECYNSLALLSSGKKEYLPIVRDYVNQLASMNLKRSYYSWHYGPVNILLAEYVMITGDMSIMPVLERVTREIIEGQSVVGSWGHRFIFPDGRLGGYGMINAPGVPLTTSLVLARKAGAKVKGLDKAIEKSTKLLRFYVGKGSIPYGDHAPWIQTHDDNGKNGAAAILFSLLGDKEAASFFSRMSIACHGPLRDGGHTGNFFNILWAMPGVALSGPNAAGSYINEFGWYYDLARKWDGSFIHQGPPDEKYDKYRFWDTTGCILLAYTQALKLTHITGKDNPLQPLSSQKAQKYIEDGRGWSYRERNKAYEAKSESELFSALKSWSPIVRDRAAQALGKKKKDYSSKLISMLNDGDLNTKLGACEALINMKKLAVPAVTALEKTLDDNELWLRIKAAEALAAIGKPAMKTLPKLLERYTANNTVKDPRQMEQRYMSEALFGRHGLLKHTMNSLDRQKLIGAIKLGLENEDGRARSSVAEIYSKFTLEQIKPLLPYIRKAIIEPSPSGIMFSSGVRLAGLDLYSKHKIKEGIGLCIYYLENQRDHGSSDRISKVLKYLERYGSHAKVAIPNLRKLADKLSKDRRFKKEVVELIISTADKFSGLTKMPELITPDS